jgi:predicted  nucleic acid-binding Zn ribbon protein
VRNVAEGEWGVEIRETRTNDDCPYRESNPEWTCTHPAHPHKGSPKYCCENLCPISINKLKTMKKKSK